jgi:hypothetical protein
VGEEATRRRKLFQKKLHKQYSTPDIIRMIKPNRRTTQTELLANMKEVRHKNEFWLGSLKEEPRGRPRFRWNKKLKRRRASRNRTSRCGLD